MPLRFEWPDALELVRSPSRSRGHTGGTRQCRIGLLRNQMIALQSFHLCPRAEGLAFQLHGSWGTHVAYGGPGQLRAHIFSSSQCSLIPRGLGRLNSVLTSFVRLGGALPRECLIVGEVAIYYGSIVFIILSSITRRPPAFSSVMA